MTTAAARALDDSVEGSVVGSITPAESPSAPAPKRRGRKTKQEAEANPVTVYRRSSGAYFARWTHPLTKERRHYKLLTRDGVPVASEALALRRAREDFDEARNEARRAAVGEAPERTVHVPTLVAGYLKYLETAEITSETALAYASHMETWVTQTRFGQVPDIRLLDGPMLVRMAGELSTSIAPEVTRERGGQAGGEYVLKVARRFTPGMVRAHLVSLSQFFRWVAKYRLPIANVVRETGILADYPAGGRGEDHVYLPHEVVRYLAVVDGERYTPRIHGNREIAYCQAYTGARIGEILRLRGAAIDWRRNTITFGNLKRNRKERAQGRRRTRTIHMWPPLRSVLWEYVQRHGVGANDWLFPEFVSAADRAAGKKPGRRTKAPYAWMQSVCRRAGIPYRHGSHVWRHVYVSVRARMRQRLEVDGHPGLYTYPPVTYETVQDEVGHRRGSDVTRAVYDKAKLVLPDTALWSLDWPAVARAVEAAEAKLAAQYVEGVLPEHAAGMTPLASTPTLAAAVPQVSIAE